MKARLHIVIIVLAWLVLPSASQAQSFENPNEVVNAFFKAISSGKDSMRTVLISKLFVVDGQMNATVHSTPYQPTQKLGSYEAFLKASAPFYRQFEVSYDEAERSIDYYQDIAMIHSLVFQTMHEKQDTTLEYEQWLWFSFDLAYEKSRWWITSVSWVNAFDSQPIDDALLQDTLWHSPER